MRYWTTDKSGLYVREDGEPCTIGQVLDKDISPIFIYDDEPLPRCVERTMEEIFIGRSF